MSESERMIKDGTDSSSDDGEIMLGDEVYLFKLINESMLNYSSSSLSCPGIHAGNVNKLPDAGISTCSVLIMLTKKSFTGNKELSEAKVSKNEKYVYVSNGILLNSHLMLHEKSKELESFPLIVLCPDVDEGILVLQNLYVSTQFPTKLIGENGKIAHIGTDGTLNQPDQILLIAEWFVRDAGPVHNNMFCASACMYERHQLHLLLLALKISEESLNLAVDLVIGFIVVGSGTELAEIQFLPCLMLCAVIADPTPKSPRASNEADIESGEDFEVSTHGDGAGTEDTVSGTDGGGTGTDGDGTGTDGGGTGTDGGGDGTDIGGAGNDGESNAGDADGAGSGGSDDDDDDDDNDNYVDFALAVATAADDDDDEEQQAEKKEEAGAATSDERAILSLWKSIPPNHEGVQSLEIVLKDFEELVNGNNYQTEVLNFALERNLLQHLLEGQELSNISSLREHFNQKIDMIKEVVDLSHVISIELPEELEELVQGEVFIFAQEIMDFAAAKEATLLNNRSYFNQV